MRIAAYWNVVLRRLVDSMALHLQLNVANLTGRDGTGCNGEGAKMLSDGNKEEEDGDGNVIILYSTDVKQVILGGEEYQTCDGTSRPIPFHLVPCTKRYHIKPNSGSPFDLSTT
ncbi:hypothetical protein DVH24_006474 [Malus domestica]|uniref:Uncharacterized protein n=1 Tax=Malus domestica TaxID=3750 RepID=A0A498KCZ1_MALDO|nr:hypothetical protein DVH24_006474 [Malus domestica]